MYRNVKTGEKTWFWCCLMSLCVLLKNGFMSLRFGN